MVEFMVDLLIAGAVVVLLVVLYLGERVIKARSRARRLQSMSDRLVAATARVDQQQEERRTEARASAALTSVMPAIKRPPLSLPGVEPRGAARPKPSGEQSGQQDHGTRGGRRSGRAGEHATQAGERHS
jgi:hypothetical protein